MNKILNMKKNYFLFLLICLLFQVNNLQGQALNFDGTNDYVQTTYSGIAGSADRTIEAWIKTTDNFNPSVGGSQGVLVDYGTFSTGQRFTFNVLWGNAIRLEVGGNGVSGTIAVNDGNWHHVAVVFLSTGNTVRLYVDGVLDTQGSLTVAANTGTANNVMIGRRVDNVNYFNGSIDEVRIWNTAKTQAEIQANMNKELCANSNIGLAAYYKLNQGVPGGNNSTVTSALDDSGNNNNGTLNGFALSGNASNWIAGATLNTSGNGTTSTFSVTSCDSYTAPSGAVYTFSQTVTDIIPNVLGCDSLMTINLTINNSQSITQNIAVCDSFVSSTGQAYYTTQTIVENLMNINGCDSTVTTFLTINRDEATANITVCDSYTAPNGQIYTNTQIVSDTFTNIHGCDSIVTLDITINKADTTVTIRACWEI